MKNNTATVLITFTLATFNTMFLANDTKHIDHTFDGNSVIVEINKKQAKEMGFSEQDWTQTEEIPPIYVDNR